MNTKIFLSLLILTIISFSDGIDVFRRKRDFAKLNFDRAGVDGELAGFGSIKDTLKAEIDKIKDVKDSDNKNVFDIFSIKAPAAHPKTFIIGDAGGSGTRLYLGAAGKDKVVVIKSPEMAALKTGYNTKVGDFVKSIATAMGDPSTIIYATAGMRAKALAGNMQTSMCGSRTNCKAGIMPGSLEGYLGWVDGTDATESKLKVKNTDCYVELGSTSSQFTFKGTKGNIKLGSVHKFFSMSGVRIGFNPISEMTNTKTACDFNNHQAHKADAGKLAEFETACLAAIKTDVFSETAFTDCMKSEKMPDPTCDQLLIRGFRAGSNKDQVYDVIKDGDIVTRFAKCSTYDAKKIKFNSNYYCGFGVLLKEWFTRVKVKSLVDTSKVLFLGETSEVEWAWGLYNYAKHSDFKVDEFVFTEQGNASDCADITV